jgi:protein-S-isoprenylcysteine O-methyltransferase Ste14
VGAIIAAFVLLLERQAHFGPLDRRFLPDSQTWIWIGIVLTACGIALAIWARSYLGANWSATITIRTGHSLVSTGPYARLRHPIYSGMLLAIAGTALAEGDWWGLLALVFTLRLVDQSEERGNLAARRIRRPIRRARATHRVPPAPTDALSPKLNYAQNPA